MGRAFVALFAVFAPLVLSPWFRIWSSLLLTPLTLFLPFTLKIGPQIANACSLVSHGISWAADTNSIEGTSSKPNRGKSFSNQIAFPDSLPFVFSHPFSGIFFPSSELLDISGILWQWCSSSRTNWIPKLVSDCHFYRSTHPFPVCSCCFIR